MVVVPEDREYQFLPGVSMEIPRRIVFVGTNDGWQGIVSMTGPGNRAVPYICTNCLANSPSKQLGKITLDADMDMDTNLPGHANCQNSCEFVLG